MNGSPIQRLVRRLPVWLAALIVVGASAASIISAAARAETSGGGGQEMVLIGEDAAVPPILDAYEQISRESAGLGKLGFADGPRERLFSLFCRPPAGVTAPDMLALIGRMTPAEHGACADVDLIETPVSGAVDERGAVKPLMLYVRRDRFLDKPGVEKFATSVLGGAIAGVGGFLHTSGLPRLSESARSDYEKRLASGEPLDPDDLGAELDVLARNRSLKGDGPASTSLMITGVGLGARLTAAEARTFAEAQGHEPPEIVYRFGAPAAEIFCSGQNTALPDILVLDWRMAPETYKACQENGFLWMTELFLGHAPPRSGSGEYRPVFLYFKKAHVEALPVVGAFLQHLVSDEVIGAGGRFAAEGFTPVAPARRLGLAAQVAEMPPIISSAAFETPIPEPWKATSAPEWASGKVIDGPRYALVIGNGGYSAEMGPLANPANDAATMKAALERAGFEVSLHTDLDQKGMRRAIRDFSRTLAEAPENSTALFYFSGHGMQTDGLNYLAPVDAEIAEESDIEIEAISANAILAQIEDAGLALNLLFLDACRNNTFERKTKSATRGLAPIKAENNTLIVYATRPGAVAYDGEGQTSPFTGALVNAIAAPGVPVEFAMKEVARSVRAETEQKQSPWIEGVLLNNFYFTPPN